MAPQVGVCECGMAVEVCEAAWAERLAREFSDPEYGAVHHLTVPAHMLQHPSRLSDHGWHEERRLLTEFLEEGIEPTEVRRRSHPEGPSLTRGDPHPLDGVHWTGTISDVRTTDASTYRSEVRAWAAAVLADLGRLDEHAAMTCVRGP